MYGHRILYSPSPSKNQNSMFPSLWPAHSNKVRPNLASYILFHKSPSLTPFPQYPRYLSQHNGFQYTSLSHHPRDPQHPTAPPPPPTSNPSPNPLSPGASSCWPSQLNRNPRQKRPIHHLHSPSRRHPSGQPNRKPAQHLF